MAEQREPSGSDSGMYPENQSPQESKFEKMSVDEADVKDFMYLSEPELERLKEDIRAADSLIRIFVHPYFENNDDLNEKEKEKFEEPIKRVLASASDGLPPVFIMEEQHRILKLKNLIRDIIKSNIYIIPTYRSHPVPRFDGEHDKSFEDGYDTTIAQKNWQELIGILKENLGVARIILGGRNLKIGPEDLVLRECVGEAINQLSGNFDLEVSFATYPANRKDYKKAMKIKK